ncbi:NADP-dependent oxidoreductase domain-containing protein [Suillus clintonianus]|uniref:NADP-dependent oxidoreductase domain-containing protein n=1 Tax=Suillus clintonianus TaxID=1904413 RepID=UPI001B86D3DB|nr:NADP-dependent oxidoreductase domain-containing protein [Suillus clintonianus]KAG2139313.1 NADP-dependent oxidoreductase domain-containing protein [Suillus clintonianus]
MSTRIRLLYGAFQFSVPGPRSLGARINTIEDAQNIIDVFASHGHKQIDTSRVYGGGTSEEFIGQLDLKGCTVDTKVFPSAPVGFAQDKIRASLEASIKALGKTKIETFYLHAPDRSVPIKDTLRAINELHSEGLFEEFGVSNYNAWEVAEIVGIAETNGWVRPTVYQGLYNALERRVETELFSCLRHYGIRFYAYSPLASGLFSGTILSEADMQTGRWDLDLNPIAGSLRAKYSLLIPILRELKGVLDKQGIPLSEAAHRWLQHHSKLQPGDGIIIGASNVDQLENNLKESEGGPLSDDVVKLLEDAWGQAKGVAPHYAF